MNDAPFAALEKRVDEGLTRADALKPGGGFVDLTAGVSSELGGFVRGEAGWHPRDDLDLFGFGEASTLGGAQAGAGLRWHF